MEHERRMQETLDYIEQHLRSEITAAELANRAGFSIWHFYRLFQRYTGLPVMQYVQRRRLLHAIYAVRSGQTRVRAALDYGFDTYAGFYKAFQREFGCTPSAFLKSNRAKRPLYAGMKREESMEFNHRQAQEALKNWGMENEPLMDFYYENSGCKAENALCAGGEYVLKRTRDGQKVCRTNALGCALKETGILAPEPVPTVKGALSVEVDGWHYSLYRRLPGEPMSSRSLFGPGGAENARFVGEVIGQLHLKLRDAQVQAREVDLLETVRGWALPRAAELLHLPNDFCQSYLKAFEKLYPALPRQIIHRDPNPGNILLSENGWGMIDLELAERNVRLYDPCYATTAVLSECFAHLDENGLHEWLGIYRSILLGYHSVAKLSEQEKQAAAYVVLANQMICVAWFATQPQLAEVYEVNRRMTRWLTAHFEELML